MSHVAASQSLVCNESCSQQPVISVPHCLELIMGLLLERHIPSPGSAIIDNLVFTLVHDTRALASDMSVLVSDPTAPLSDTGALTYAIA